MKMENEEKSLDEEDQEKVKRVRQILEASEKRKIKNLNLLGDD